MAAAPKTVPRRLTKADIIAAQDLDYEDVPVPEWGGIVRVRVMTGTEWDSFITKSRENDAQSERILFLSLVLVDEDNEPLFTEAEIDALGKKSFKVLERLALKAQKFVGLADDSMEEAEKN